MASFSSSISCRVFNPYPSLSLVMRERVKKDCRIAAV
jgi:hypothetical protein